MHNMQTQGNLAASADSERMEGRPEDVLQRYILEIIFIISMNRVRFSCYSSKKISYYHGHHLGWLIVWI